MPTMMRMMPIIPAGFTGRMLQRATAANQLDNENDQRDHEQEMNVSAQNMEADETQQPKNQQNNKDSPKHKNLSFEVVTNASFRRRQSRLPKFTREVSILLLSGFFKHGAYVPAALFQLRPG
jgi:hypothetical protein